MRPFRIAQIILACSILAAVGVIACESREDRKSATAVATPQATVAATVVAPLFTPQPSLPVTDLSYPGGVLHVEVASTPDQRSRGLSGRPSLGDDEGMLFDLGQTRVPGFSMRGMQFPLDFVWIGDDQRVKEVTADAQPEPDVPLDQLRSYSPAVPVRYVLEIDAGSAARLGIAADDSLQFALP